jgi:hypothetical protein
VFAVRRFLEQPSVIEEVVFCCFSVADLTIYQRLLKSKTAAGLDVE